LIRDFAARGEPPPVPRGLRAYSGKFVVRLGPELHRGLSEAAERAGLSLNAYVIAKLSPVSVDAPSGATRRVRKATQAMVGASRDRALVRV